MMRIGQLARATGETVKTLRYWSDRGLLDASREPGSRYRRFRAEAPGRVAFIRSAQQLGLALDDVAEVLDLRRSAGAPCEHVVARLREHRDAVRARIRSLAALERDLDDRIAWAASHPNVPCERDCVYVASAPGAELEGSDRSISPARTSSGSAFSAGDKGHTQR